VPPLPTPMPSDCVCVLTDYFQGMEAFYFYVENRRDILNTTVNYTTIGDRMCLGMKDFDFCPNLTIFYPNFIQIYSNFTKFT